MIKMGTKRTRRSVIIVRSTYGGEERRIQGFGGGTMKERDHLKDLAFDGSKMDLKEVGCGDMDWIDLAQDRDRWRALVKEVINLRVP
jgi:hypothetical protein